MLRRVVLCVLSFVVVGSMGAAVSQENKLEQSLTKEGEVMNPLEKNLQELLSTLFILYTKTLNHHWNITGKHFAPLHKMLNDNYLKLLGEIDTVAEHMRALGLFPAATCADFIAQSQIKEASGKKLGDMDMLKDLEAGHRIVIEQLKKLFETAEQGKYYSTTDLATGLSLENEKMAWMLKSYFE